MGCYKQMKRVCAILMYKKAINYNIFQRMSRSKSLPKGPHVEVCISTWTKDSHGLYDYEAQEDSYRQETHFINKSCKIYRDNHKPDTVYICTSKIIDVNGKHNDNNNNSLVAQVYVDKSKTNPEFKLKCHNRETEKNLEGVWQHRTPYLVVQQFGPNGADQGHPLHPGSIIKFGRVQYLVLQSKNDLGMQTIRNTNHFDEANGIFQIKKHLKDHDQAVEQGQNSCKVCLCSQETEGDPLISPCQCKGSCRLIHVGCLRTWINSKVKKDIKGIVQSYNFTKFECQICKSPFPKIVRFGEEVSGYKDLEMMTISKPNKPYILFQSLGNKQQNKDERWLHLISPEENSPIRIGRGHDCEIRITDISVSRKHAEIKLIDGEFYIANTHAKFGTLVRLEEDFQLNHNKPLRIQFGRTVFEFKVKAQQVEEVDTE